jgi:uncharacterized protein
VRQAVQRQAPPNRPPALPGRYLSLTSFRRDGTGVAAPVWFVEDGKRPLVETDAASYKVRRIRRDPRVTIAPCTGVGPAGPGHPGAHAVVIFAAGSP